MSKALINCIQIKSPSKTLKYFSNEDVFFLIGLWYVRFLPAVQLAGIIHLFDAIVLSQWKWLFSEELVLYFWASHKNILDKVQPDLTFFHLRHYLPKHCVGELQTCKSTFLLAYFATWCSYVNVLKCTHLLYDTEKNAVKLNNLSIIKHYLQLFFPPSDTVSNFFMPAFLYLTVEWSCFTPTTLWTHLGL